MRRNLIFRGAAVAAAVFLFAGACAADTLVLTGGGTVDGAIRKVDGGYNVVADDGKTTFVPDAQVAAFRLGGGTSKPADDGGKVVDPALASLRRSADNLDDLSIIVGKYERFIEQRKDDAAVAAAAREDLARYEGYRDQGYVKFNGEWVAAGDRSAALRDKFQNASDARQQIKDGDVAAARATIDKMLAADADDVSGLYLGGVLAQRSGDVTAARNAFERVRRQLPKHAPTLLNLAAINIKFNQQPRALTFLTDAMRAEPGNQEILDGVAEALAMLDDRTAKSRQATLARRAFDQQDAALKRQMEAKGLFRWGSKWVPRGQYDELKRMSDEIDRNVRQIQAQQQSLRADVQAIDRQIVENNAYMQQLDQSRNYVDKNGKVMQGPLPPAYFDAQNRGAAMQRERAGREGQAASLDAQIAAERSRYPTPPYDGAIAPVGEDGVPVTLPPAPGKPAADEPKSTGDDATEPGDASDEPAPDAATQPATEP